jgi:hypothetical protein
MILQQEATMAIGVVSACIFAHFDITILYFLRAICYNYNKTTNSCKGGRRMKITSSYGVELLQVNKILAPTISIYRSAVAFLAGVVQENWDVIRDLGRTNKKNSAIEKLVHATKSYTPKYDFDVRFPKMPCYLRRAAISSAIGAVSSYRSNYANWEANGKVGKPPRLQTDRAVMPCFYNGNTYCEGETPNTVLLKLFVKNDWRFVPIRVSGTDKKYLQKRWSHVKASAPTLEKRYGKYYLRFCFDERYPH